MSYPRTPGLERIVHEEEWNPEAPFGNCPACGSIGIEELYIPGDKDITFYCSDGTCKTIMGERFPARTKWYQTKPQEILDKELRESYSWNNDHFPGQKLPEVCPD